MLVVLLMILAGGSGRRATANFPPRIAAGKSSCAMTIPFCGVGRRTGVCNQIRVSGKSGFHIDGSAFPVSSLVRGVVPAPNSVDGGPYYALVKVSCKNRHSTDFTLISVLSEPCQWWPPLVHLSLFRFLFSGKFLT